MLKRLFSSVIAALILCALPAQAAVPAGEPDGLAEAAIGKGLSGHILVDRHGKSFNLSGLFGKPLVVSYVYTSCGHVCPTMMANLKAAFEKAGKAFGGGFTSLTIGFDVKNDTPKALDAYASHFAEGLEAWRFATAGQKTMDALTKELGFYFREAPGKAFDHINMVTVIDKDGVVFRQIYGLDFSADELLRAVKLAGSGYGTVYGGRNPVPLNPAGMIDRVKLFCYRYDETSGKYKFAYGAVFALGIGAALQLATIVWIFRRLKGR
ncbi:MAG: SCO family protein [Deltaproteobacteria bacterium]|nr:SCO family protein [Deltaproteobacteria bacterium]